MYMILSVKISAISGMEEEQYDKAIILFEGLPRDYEDARNNFRE